jgi:hypothetical protein
MSFAERIAPEIKRGQMRNADDEEISRMDQQFPQAEADDGYSSK